MGLGANLAGLGTVDNIMKNRVNDAKFLGIGSLGLALLAVADVRKLKNTVLSAENRAILNVIKPYLDDDEKDYTKNIDKSDGYKIGMNGTMGGTIAMATSFIAGKTTLVESLTVGMIAGSASLLAEEVVRTKDIKENHQFLTNRIYYLNKGR